MVDEPPTSRFEASCTDRSFVHERGDGLRMTADARWVRWLGAAFVAQFITGVAAEILAWPITSGRISAVLVSITRHVVQIRLAIVANAATWVGIIVMTSLLYVILRARSKPVALVALVLWVADVTLSVVGVVGLYALLTLSAGFGRAGAPATSYYETLGTLLQGLEQHAVDLSLVFFSLGALLWYTLFFTSRLVPRALSVWGLVAMLPVVAGALLMAWDHSLHVPPVLELPYLPFELVIGLWLLVGGANHRLSTAPGTPRMAGAARPE
jgi:hypothetical protein